MKIDLLVKNAGQLVTMAGHSDKAKRGARMAELSIIEDGAVAVKGGMIAAVGTTEAVLEQVQLTADSTVIDARGRVVLPGLVDSHTHIVFAGSRENEFEMKIKGTAYLDILAAGGGILSTVQSTRAADENELVLIGERYLGEMLAQGTTTAEAKSGYGLTVEDELKQLRAIQALQQRQPVELVPTFMGAHAIPEEYKEDPDAFIDLVIDKMLPAVSGADLAECCDIFCEEGVFNLDQSSRVFQAAQRLGFKLKIHADEITSLGGAGLAAEMGALSADHLVMITRPCIERLADSSTVAVLLPATTFCLMGDKYAPAREMIEAGVAVALASDFNPGSSPVNSLPIVMGVACRQLKMTPAEALSAVTINAAHAIGRAAEVGSIEVGKRADLVIFNAADYRTIAYRFGTNLVEKVIKAGRLVVERLR